jgi:hypothetical protein
VIAAISDDSLLLGLLLAIGYLAGKAAEFLVFALVAVHGERERRANGLPAATAREIRRARKAGRLVLK